MTRLILGLGLLLFLGFTAVGQKDVESGIDVNQLKPAILYWDFGTLETIYRTRDEKGTYWNVVHRDFEPEKETDGFDYYKVDGKTLRPIVSRMYHPGHIDYLIRFTPEKVSINFRDDKEKADYDLDVSGFLAPEGPGLPLFLGSLPLRIGYEVQYRELDRWSGTGGQKGVVVNKKLRVLSSDKIGIDGKDVETLKLEITSDQGSSLTAWVLRKSPHYWVKTEYRPVGGRVFKGQVTKILIFQ